MVVTRRGKGVAKRILLLPESAVSLQGKPSVYMGSPKPFQQQDEETDVLDDIGMECSLIVWNDEVNTFDWVIQALVEICEHTQEQAEQCAMIIHTHGKYAVKNGTYEVLKPMCDAITDRGIGATVEALSGS